MRHDELVAGMPVWWKRASGPGGRIKASIVQLPKPHGRVGLACPYVKGMVWVQARYLSKRQEVSR